MAHSVAWLPDAVADLEAIARYIAVDSPAYAAVVVERITLAARALAEFPEIGRIVPEWNDESVRERIVYNAGAPSRSRQRRGGGRNRPREQFNSEQESAARTTNRVRS